MADTSPNKAALRSLLRQRRNALTLSQQLAAAEALLASVVRIPAWATAQRIAVYLPADGEIDPQPLARLAQAQDKQLFLPVIGEDLRLQFATWKLGDRLVSNRFNIPEPTDEAERHTVTGLDIVFLPLVAWDERGGRLGMGGGFYDRALTGVSGPLRVGLAHECQRIDAVPRDDWDIDLDFIATDVALYCRQHN
jgi:5-formyltetrahydrofolate cyclo-ligase